MSGGYVKDHAAIFNTAKGAATDWLSTAFTPRFDTSVMRIGVCMDTAGKFQMRVSDGSNTITVVFNSDTNLTANAGYTFVWPCRSNLTYNFRSDQAITVLDFKVEEISGALI